MNTCKRSGVLIAGLFLLALLAGCGSSSTSNTVPTVEQAFYSHSVVFDNNSTLMTSGYNGFGQLGDGTLTTPVPFVSTVKIGRVSGYAAGANHTLAFANHSTIWAWGSNLHGRLGINSNPSYAKTAISGTDAFTKYPLFFKVHNEVLSIATGWNHSLAVAGPNRSVLSWGANNVGQLGNNGLYGAKNFDDVVVPGRVVGEDGTGALDNIVQVAAGGSHCLALRDDGTIFSWGDNQFGQLGYPTTSTAAPTLYFGVVPKQVPAFGTAKVVEVAAAGSFSAARLADGTVWAWGYNVFGQCGTKPVINSTQILAAPTQVKNLDDTPFLATKISCGTMHMIALRAVRDESSGNLINTGEVWGWGWNEKAQLGLSHVKTLNGQPVIVNGQPAIEDVTSLLEYAPQKAAALDLIQVNGAPTLFATDIYAFGTVSFARIDGKWYGWGDNGFGQLGKIVPTDAIPLIFTPVEFKLFMP